jgi:hypothetical protein
MSLMKHLFCQFFMCVILLWTVWAAIHLPRTGIFPIHLFNNLMSMKDDDALCLILDLRVDIVIVSQFLISSSSSCPSIHQLSLQVFNSFSFFCFLICCVCWTLHQLSLQVINGFFEDSGFRYSLFFILICCICWTQHYWGVVSCVSLYKGAFVHIGAVHDG